MRIGKTMVVVASAGLLAGGCNSSGEASTTIGARPGVEFQYNPKTSFYASDCAKNPNTWVKHIDSDPNDVEGALRANTIGMVASPSQEADGSPIFLLGATIEGLGGAAYKLAVADSVSEVVGIVDLDEGAISLNLSGTDDYDAVFSARLGKDKKAYFQINCLPNFDFHGDREVVDLNDLPTISSDSTVPRPTTVDIATA